MIEKSSQSASGPIQVYYDGCVAEGKPMLSNVGTDKTRRDLYQGVGRTGRLDFHLPQGDRFPRFWCQKSKVSQRAMRENERT